MNDNKYTTVRVKNWQEFKLFIDSFSEYWAFRGQAYSEWLLNNAIERTDFIEYYDGIEVDFLAEFQRGALNYLTKDETPAHIIEWLALMQHHGAPTRLLDLTKSPFIAAYFAFELSLVNPDSCVAIWCLNIEVLKNRALDILSKEFGEALKKSDNLINEELFEKVFYQNKKNLVFPVEPFRMNRRYSLQQSIFVSTGTSKVPLMDQLMFLDKDLPKAVVKIEIPVTERKLALRDLLKMNLHKASLFPDLDGYATSLRLRYDSMKRPEELKKEQEQKAKDDEYPFFP
jgi:hypothetical protein